MEGLGWGFGVGPRLRHALHCAKGGEGGRWAKQERRCTCFFCGKQLITAVPIPVPCRCRAQRHPLCRPVVQTHASLSEGIRKRGVQGAIARKT